MTITDTQKVQGEFVPVDAKGNRTDPAGPLTVSVGDASILEATVDDATHFTVRALGPLGMAVPVTVTDGVATAQDTLDVTGGAEAGASITFGAPSEQ